MCVCMFMCSYIQHKFKLIKINSSIVLSCHFYSSTATICI
uniref:Uncharacterized protein n=1 Tax=Rhizophora mucronata TaxID=61149 RepID=A0A2P2Q0N3_RHIMU